MSRPGGSKTLLGIQVQGHDLRCGNARCHFEGWRGAGENYQEIRLVWNFVFPSVYETLQHGKSLKMSANTFLESINVHTFHENRDICFALKWHF